jgi:predicted Ser/Thr protein kinase
MSLILKDVNKQVPFAGRTLKDLLRALPNDPYPVAAVRARMCALMEASGLDVQKSEEFFNSYGKRTRMWNCLSKFYGLEESFHALYYALRAAAAGGEADRQQIVLVGDPGTGKTDVCETLKDMLAASRPVVAIESCPHHCNPLNATIGMVHQLARRRAWRSSNFEQDSAKAREEIIDSLQIAQLLQWGHPDLQAVAATLGSDRNNPAALATLNEKHLADAIIFGLGLSRSTRANIGPLCPVCYARMLGIFEKAPDLADMPIVNFHFARDDLGTKGIGTSTLQELNNFSIAEWIGEEDMHQQAMGLRQPISDYPEDLNAVDPKAVRLTGLWNMCNRGIIIEEESCVLPWECHQIKVHATQNKELRAPSPLKGHFHSDLWPIGNTNFKEWNDFMGDDQNAKLFARTIAIEFRSPTVAKWQAKVDDKFWARTDFAPGVEGGLKHQDPLVRELTAYLKVMAVLEPNKGLSFLQKADLYNGRVFRLPMHAETLDPAVVRAAAGIGEGHGRFGTSRDLMKIIQPLAAMAEDFDGCLSVIDMYEAIKTQVPAITRLNEELSKKLKGIIETDLHLLLRREISHRVLLALRPEVKRTAQAEFSEYLRLVFRFIDEKTVEDRDKLEKLEREMGIPAAAAQRIRESVYRIAKDYKEHSALNRDLPYDADPEIKQILERKVIRTDSSGNSSLVRTLAASTEQGEELRHRVIANLNEHAGCCDVCAHRYIEAVQKDGFLYTD